MRYLIFLISLLFANQAISQAKRQGMDRALFFAVAQYQDDQLPHLPQTIKNAREIAQVLKNKYGFETEVVENPSLDDIEAKLSTYRKQYASGRLPKEGQLLIFFSGHGVKEFNNGYFLPADADTDRILRTGLSYNIWRPFMSQINCKHILVAIDACYSVTFDPQWNTMNGSNDFRRIGELSETARILENHKQHRSRIFLTSDAREDVVPGRSNFARKFLEGLSQLQYTLPFATSSKLFADYIEKAQPSPKGGSFEEDDPRSAFLFFPKIQLELNNKRYTQRQQDIEAYKAIQSQPNIAACQQYLSDFPTGEFRTQIYALLLQLQEEQEWELARLKNTKASYQVYLNRYPSGAYANEARIKLGQIEKGKQPSRTTISPPSTPELDNMVFVKGGTFQMGSKDGRSNETPHTVTLSDYYMARHEVTVKDYLAFTKANDKHLPEWLEKGSKYNIQTGGDDHYKKIGKALQGDKYPIVGVSWYNAIAYCNWLSDQEGYQKVYSIAGTKVTVNWNANGYRLPTEAEWEYAARSRGKDQKWAGTSTESQLTSFANGSGETDGYKYTSPVGTFKANDLGLFDMSGNVREWCWDWYGSDYYTKSTGTAPKGPNIGAARVRRGGSWRSSPARLRCAFRYFGYPDLRSNFFGFRLSRAGR